MLGISVALVVGKPVGMLALSAMAVHWGLATKPDAYSWGQVAGAGALAGIGFTMSLLIAGEAFADPANFAAAKIADFAAAKIAVFAASILAAMVGTGILWREGGRQLSSGGD